MQDSINHMTLKSHFISNFAPKHHHFGIRKRDFFMDVNAKHYSELGIGNPLVDYCF